jgi:hypothetical protein
MHIVFKVSAGDYAYHKPMVVVAVTPMVVCFAFEILLTYLDF